MMYIKNSPFFILIILGLFVSSFLFVTQNKISAQSPYPGTQTNFNITTSFYVDGASYSSRKDNVNVGTGWNLSLWGGYTKNTTGAVTFSTSLGTVQASNTAGNVEGSTSLNAVGGNGGGYTPFVGLSVNTVNGPGDTKLESITWTCRGGSVISTDKSISPGSPSIAPETDCSATLNYSSPDDPPTPWNPINHAQFVSYSNVYNNLTMQTGETRNVTVNMRNDGTTTWGSTYTLRSIQPSDNPGLWGISQVPMPGGTSSNTLSSNGPVHLFNFIADRNWFLIAVYEIEFYDPSGNRIYPNGCYIVNGSMDNCEALYDGDTSTSVQRSGSYQNPLHVVLGLGWNEVGGVRILYAKPDGWEDETIETQFQNDSGTTFFHRDLAMIGYIDQNDSGNYEAFWDDLDPYFESTGQTYSSFAIGTASGGSGSAIGPNQTAAFNFNITAPTTPGIYPFQWRMHQDSTGFDNSSELILIKVEQPGAITADLQICDGVGNCSDTAAYPSNFTGPLYLNWETTGSPSSCVIDNGIGWLPSYELTSGSRPIAVATAEYHITCSRVGVPDVQDNAKAVITADLRDCRTEITTLPSGGTSSNPTPTSYTATWIAAAPSSAVGTYGVRVAPNTSAGQIEADSGCGNWPSGPCVAKSGEISSPLSYYVSGLTPETSYYNRVYARCAVPNTNGLPSYVDHTWVSTTNPNSATADITANPITIPYNSNSTISWSYSNATNCVLTPPLGSVSSYPSGSGNYTVTGLTSSQTYQISCAPPESPRVTKSVTVNVDAPLSRSISLTKGGQGVVTSSPSGINCGLSCSSQLYDGFTQDSSVTLTAEPQTGRIFVGWGGDCSGRNNTCTLSMTGNKTVVAVFTIDPSFKEF